MWTTQVRLARVSAGFAGLLMACMLTAQEPARWNVSEPDFFVAPQSIAIDTTQGTWMSLDVHPQGTAIVFDLLGDLYLLPMEGGEARNISPGFQWDMQPRFSPDGKMIAFTSDRDGGDNIWVMNADGSEPRQISTETFQLVNNASWSPDGRYLAARKHFTTQRSLGAGEIWLYHLHGGKGVRLVERPSPKFQKELGEPVFAPDGSAVYYSQNVTSGDAFVYAQDTNKEVFRIRKYVMARGERLDVAGGPGGAVTPTPSPDGRYLAFVRRVRADSRLFVKDLRTGDERMLVDQLDPDMQESWAIHGVYPNMASHRIRSRSCSGAPVVSTGLMSTPARSPQFHFMCATAEPSIRRYGSKRMLSRIRSAPACPAGHSPCLQNRIGSSSSRWVVCT